jgi:hypothetical protein
VTRHITWIDISRLADQMEDHRDYFAQVDFDDEATPKRRCFPANR